MTPTTRTRSGLALVGALGLLQLACGGASCRDGCVQSEKWVELQAPEYGSATLTFTVSNVTVVLDEEAFRERVAAYPALRPKGRARIGELLASGEAIEARPGGRGVEARCFYMLTHFIDQGEVSVSLDGVPLARLRTRDVLYGDPEEWSATRTREYWTEDGERFLEFVTMIQ